MKELFLKMYNNFVKKLNSIHSCFHWAISIRFGHFLYPLSFPLLPLFKWSIHIVLSLFAYIFILSFSHYLYFSYALYLSLYFSLTLFFSGLLTLILSLSLSLCVSPSCASFPCGQSLAISLSFFIPHYTGLFSCLSFSLNLSCYLPLSAFPIFRFQQVITEYQKYEIFLQIDNAANFFCLFGIT